MKQRILAYNLANKLMPEQLSTVIGGNSAPKGCGLTSEYVFSDGYWQLKFDAQCIG